MERSTTSFTFSTPWDHSGTIKPVQQVGGAMEGRWICQISDQDGTTKTLYAQPFIEDATARIGACLLVPPSTISIQPSAATVAKIQPTASIDSLAIPSNQQTKTKSAVTTPTMISAPALIAIDQSHDVKPYLQAALSPVNSILTSQRSETNVESTLDKFESSPNSRAKCRECHEMIALGTMRLGVYTYEPETFYKEIYHYYHSECCSETKRNKLRLASQFPSVAAGNCLQNLTTQFDSTKVREGGLLRERHFLRERLRLLRTVSASQLRQSPDLVFDDKTLDQLVLKMPRTEADLKATCGFAGKKERDVGASILLAVAQYCKYQETQATASGRSLLSSWGNEYQTTAAITAQQAQSNTSRSASTMSSSRNTEGDVCIEASTLSCEEIVAKKFEEADRTGQMITL